MNTNPPDIPPAPGPTPAPAPASAHEQAHEHEHEHEHEHTAAWLSVLAGQQAATDRATRQAQGLRQYVVQQIAQERQHAPDPAQEARLLARLRQRGAFAPALPPGIAPTNPHGTLLQRRFAALVAAVAKRLPRWPTRSPAHHGADASGPTHIATHPAVWPVTLVLLATGVVLMLHYAGWWGSAGGNAATDPAITRAIPGWPPAQSSTSANPAQSAAQVQQLLAQAGARASVTHEGTGEAATLLLQAELTPAQRQSLAANLAAWKISVPASGKLLVRFKKVHE